MKKLLCNGLLALAMVATLPLNVHATNDNTLTYNLGEMEQVKKNTGYSEVIELDSKDAHYGWELGQFYVEDFTQKTEDSEGNPVFLKTVGDKVQLNFVLNQDIDQLNGDEKLRIDVDKKGENKQFQTEATDFGRGALFIQHTDYQNKKAEPVLYVDYLSGVTRGAATEVDLLEEGDYQVVLDYKVGEYTFETNDIPFVSDDFQHPLWPVGETYHRIAFEFSVRNGNCMAFPKDVVTDQELTESSVAVNGFYLDLAKSRYLKPNVKLEVLVESADGLVKDTRFNRSAKDGEEYTDEGIYTITVSNEYTNETTTKKIYVGSTGVLFAHMVTGLPVQEIAHQVELGAVIEADGTITAAPVVAPVTPEPKPTEPVVPTVEDVVENIPAEVEPEPSVDTTLLIGGAVAIIAVIGAVLVMQKKPKED